ncbi:putative RNA polymerase II subunit B1 CTD phosphatase RPAP2 isoform X2 [Limulus polyphemus]|nr:putative RNA polymerase II subunit B1 CTD phosphatase RPAP2 isoform X2 [Limulus polyphemus]XP_022243070.1 putative RNA polymerase II subunit B1 CTD phosphatase RPAP2 isoform X2 [Limulus polyphemus]XP_022243071.1 putative RNA polymerase II subunit B1 CTD phosphatase RPAP2 isoform X2 [Limulus polyphemus]XP_022243072.1 putative RNA polymerase II subunit B1 CTD phosphatase RPAP2 isoform X2 [Limulus polyphemus]
MLASRSKQEECRKNALKIVQDALEGTVSEEWLIGVANIIDQAQYDDITEERSLTKACGYPLCKNRLGKLPSQRYHISLRTKKVYDITERKQFCSNQCFKASKYFKQQLSTSPIWLREDEKEIKVTLLCTSNRSGRAGDEVDLGYNRVTMKEVTSLPKKEPVFQKTRSQGPYVSKQDLEKLASHLDKLSVNVKEHSSSDKKASAVDKDGKSEKLQEDLLGEGKSQDEIINENQSQEVKKSTSMNQFVDVCSNPLNLSPLSLLEPSSSRASKSAFEKSESCPSDDGSKENLEDINPVNESFKNNNMQNPGDTNSYENQSESLTISTTSDVRVAETSTSDNTVWTKQATSDKTEMNESYLEELSINSAENCIPTEPLPRSSLKETLSSSERDDNSHLLLDPITAIEKTLVEWVTPKTLENLLGKEKFHHILDEFQSDQGCLTNDYYDQEKKEQMRLKYLHLCHKLEINEQIENELDAEYLKEDSDEKKSAG